MAHFAQAGSFSAGINMPRMLWGNELHGLPPYGPINAYRVSDFPNAPKVWSRGDERTATYFVPVMENQGMWIDLTPNARLGTHVAALVSIQGVNALTARKMEAQPVLEQYRTACPVHGTPFIGNRHCAACGFDWPAQNYLSSATGHTMWIDGFRTKGSNDKPSAETRQFFFTSDTSRGIAAQTIGDARTFSVKIYFFQGPAKPMVRPGYRAPMVLSASSAPTRLRAGVMSASSAKSFGSFEIGAGARIRQDIGVDPLAVHQYGAEMGAIEFYYVSEEVVAGILGSRSSGEGALSGLAVGNPGPANTPHKTY